MRKGMNLSVEFFHLCDINMELLPRNGRRQPRSRWCQLAALRPRPAPRI